VKNSIMALGVAVALALPGSGHAAGVMYSFIHSTIDPEPLLVDCVAQNFNTSQQTCTIDALDSTGTIVSTTGPIPLAPGSIAELPNPNTGPIMTTCRYTVTGSIKKWRASALVIGASDFKLRALVDGK
jgi:hypothetical protein